MKIITCDECDNEIEVTHEEYLNCFEVINETDYTQVNSFVCKECSDDLPCDTCKHYNGDAFSDICIGCNNFDEYKEVKK